MPTEMEMKIRKLLGDDYHLCSDNRNKWVLYKSYADPKIYFSNDNKPIMTSEKHTYKQLYNFAKKTHMIDIPLLNCNVRLVMASIILVLATINLFTNSTTLRTIIYTSNIIMLIETLIHYVGIGINEQALKTRRIFERKNIRMYCDRLIEITEKGGKK